MPGYQLIATTLEGESVASYAEGDTLAVAYERCKQQFPPEQGYTDHELWSIETGDVYEPETLEMLFD